MKHDPYIPLLSGKSLQDFTPEEYKIYVRSLFHKPEPKKAPKKEAKPFTYRLNKKGNLCLRINRSPKWITEEETVAIEKELGLERGSVEKKCIKAKIEIRDPRQMELPLE